MATVNFSELHHFPPSPLMAEGRVGVNVSARMALVRIHPTPLSRCEHPRMFAAASGGRGGLLNPPHPGEGLEGDLSPILSSVALAKEEALAKGDSPGAPVPVRRSR